MLTSLAIIFLLGLITGKIFEKIGLPSLIGWILTGMMISPYLLDLLDPKILDISQELRQIALVIILTRAGFTLNISDLRKVGRPAVLMCFLPAIFEILAILFIGPRVLGLTYLEAAIMGSVVTAVSPAVVVPRMITLIEEGYGREKSIPQLILAGASVDDVFVIVLFTSFISLAQGGGVSVFSFLAIPISILTGVLLGMIVGRLIAEFFKRFSIEESIQVLIVLSLSFLLLQLENSLEEILPISGLLAIMALGMTLAKKDGKTVLEINKKYNNLWKGAEILLFVLVGASVDIHYAFQGGFSALIIVLFALVFRMVGVFISLLKTELNLKERLFAMMAYTPKATVQAAIGGIPLSLGLPRGQDILTVAVLAILMTAPFGAIGIDKSHKKLLVKS